MCMRSSTIEQVPGSRVRRSRTFADLPPLRVHYCRKQQTVSLHPMYVRACQLAQYGQQETWCTDGRDVICRYAIAMSVLESKAAMLLLLSCLLLAASGALADESYETVHLAKGHNSLAAALSRPQKHASRALLVVGGRNDPEVPRFCQLNSQCAANCNRTSASTAVACGAPSCHASACSCIDVAHHYL